MTAAAERFRNFQIEGIERQVLKKSPFYLNR
jgi:hypothetical protein